MGMLRKECHGIVLVAFARFELPGKVGRDVECCAFLMLCVVLDALANVPRGAASAQELQETCRLISFTHGQPV